MSPATGLVLTVQTTSATRPVTLSYPVIRSLLEHKPEIAEGADGSRFYTYRMTGAEIRGALQAVDGVSPSPTADGIAFCLASLAEEARQIGLEQASWAIDLAAQLISFG